MRKILLAGFLLLLAPVAMAQKSNTVTLQFAGVPTGSCSNIMFAINTTNGDFYDCNGGTWNKVTGGGGGSGTVTSVGTSSPLTGGPITVSGTIACATCVTSSSPGAGIAHFAGSTQAVTSSAVSLSADVTGNLPVSNLNSGTSASSSTFWRGDASWVASCSPTSSTGTVLASNAANNCQNTSITDNGTTVSSTEPATFGSSIGTTTDGTHAGTVDVPGNTTLPTDTPANTFSLFGPNSASFTCWGLQPQATAPSAAGVALVAASAAITGSTNSCKSSALTFGLVPLTDIATQAADTVVMNASGSSASPTAVAMPTTGTNGCAGTTNALTYNTSTHALGCNTISSGSSLPAELINTTPVTDATNGVQNLMSLSTNSGDMNTTNRHVRLVAQGILTTTTGAQNITIALTGMGATLCSIATAANASVNNKGWTLALDIVVTTTGGGTGVAEVQGMLIGGNDINGTNAGCNNTATIGSLTTTGVVTFQVTANWTNTGNSISQRQMFATYLN